MRSRAPWDRARGRDRFRAAVAANPVINRTSLCRATSPLPLARPSNLIAMIACIARWLERYRTEGPAAGD